MLAAWEKEENESNYSNEYLFSEINENVIEWLIEQVEERFFPEGWEYEYDHSKIEQHTRDLIRTKVFKEKWVDDAINKVVAYFETNHQKIHDMRIYFWRLTAELLDRGTIKPEEIPKGSLSRKIDQMRKIEHVKSHQDFHEAIWID